MDMLDYSAGYVRPCANPFIIMRLMRYRYRPTKKQVQQAMNLIPKKIDIRCPGSHTNKYTHSTNGIECYVCGRVVPLIDAGDRLAEHLQ